MDRAPQMAAANTAVHSALNDLSRDGHDPQDLANVMMAYALNTMVETHGRQDVARHLYLLALKFADNDQNPLDGAPSKH